MVNKNLMELLTKKYIIVELIPTSSIPETGEIIQISALKLDGLRLLDRFDYRLTENKLPIPEMISWISYDKESFTYLDSSRNILTEFTKWSEDLPILILDEIYTPKYLGKLKNQLLPILSFLDEVYSTDIIDKLIDKYKLQPSNYIVDLLYESLIQKLS